MKKIMEIYADENEHKWLVKSFKRQYYLFSKPEDAIDRQEQYDIVTEYDAVKFMMKIFENLRLKEDVVMKEDSFRPVIKVSLKLGK
jgi:hypothetical protein